MRNIKYVMIEECTPVIFTDPISHKDLKGHGEITSAGFLHFESGELHVYGESLSLKMGPGPRDKELIEAFLARSYAV